MNWIRIVSSGMLW